MTGGDIATFRTQAAAFLARSVEDGVACPDFGAILPPALHHRARAWARAIYDAGLAGLHWPEPYGGRGLSREHTAVWLEECARADVAPQLNIQGIVLAGEAILRSGTEEQRRRFLRPTLTGEVLWCQLFSEPGAGSDLAALRTTAARTGAAGTGGSDSHAATGDRGGYVIDGQKTWSSNAELAEYAILLARTDPTLPGHRGISFFLLDMATPGVTVRPIRQMTGESEFSEVVLDRVRVPGDALLGPENHGWAVAMDVLTDERGTGGAGPVGLERRLAYLRSLLRGAPAMRDRLLRLYARGHALRALLLRADRGDTASSAAKLLRSEFEFDVELLATTLRGADAMLASPATDRFLYTPGMRIAGGTSEIQRNIIAERILGLPRR